MTESLYWPYRNIKIPFLMFQFHVIINSRTPSWQNTRHTIEHKMTTTSSFKIFYIVFISKKAILMNSLIFLTNVTRISRGDRRRRCRGRSRGRRILYCWFLPVDFCRFLQSIFFPRPFMRTVYHTWSDPWIKRILKVSVKKLPDAFSISPGHHFIFRTLCIYHSKLWKKEKKYIH